jgi:hypothetical protein
MTEWHMPEYKYGTGYIQYSCPSCFKQVEHLLKEKVELYDFYNKKIKSVKKEREDAIFALHLKVADLMKEIRGKE